MGRFRLVAADSSSSTRRRLAASSAITSRRWLGISRLTVAKILNHVETGVTATYDRYSYDAEKAAALNAWAARLDAIVKGETTGAKVIPLARA